MLHQRNSERDLRSLLLPCEQPDHLQPLPGGSPHPPRPPRYPKGSAPQAHPMEPAEEKGRKKGDGLPLPSPRPCRAKIPLLREPFGPKKGEARRNPGSHPPTTRGCRFSRDTPLKIAHPSHDLLFGLFRAVPPIVLLVALLV